nr:VCBS domain-containing protein [Shewanella psychropiezotolerans]
MITTLDAEDTGTVVEVGIIDDFDANPANNNTPEPGIAAISGTLSATDVDNNASWTWSGDDSGTYGEFVIDSVTGEWTYTLNDSDLVNELASNESHNEIFTVTVTDEFGGTDTHDVTITVEGTNDAPIITTLDAEDTGTVVEVGIIDDFDANPANNNTPEPGIAAISGTLSATDVDNNASWTWSGDDSGTYGEFVIDSVTGEWTYTLNDSDLVNELASNESHNEIFTVTVTDEFGGTDTHDVTITVEGTNDAPIITTLDAEDTGTVVEVGIIDDFDANPANNNTPEPGIAAISGTLSATDVDNNASWTWSGDDSGTYGEFVIDSVTGEWTYTLNDSDLVNELASNESHNEIFTVTVTDEFGGTDTHDVTITVEGTNDAPIITTLDAEDTGTVVEVGIIDDFDANPANNNTPEPGIAAISGTLSATDVDNNASWTWSGDDSGTYGEFVIDSVTGEWTYTLNDSDLVNELASNESHNEIFTVTVTDEFGGPIPTMSPSLSKVPTMHRLSPP